MDNEALKRALAQVVKAVVDTVNEGGAQGTPSGIVYAALMQQGCTLSQYESLIGALVALGKISKRGDLLFPVTIAKAG